MNGQSYAAVLVGWLPRTMWEQKPPISLGGIVKSEIFGERLTVGGYPPGFVGEAVMNFGSIAVPAISFLLGAMLRLWYNSFSPLLGKSRGATAVYAITIWSIGTQTVDLNFSLALSQAGQSALPMLELRLWIVTQRRRPLVSG